VSASRTSLSVVSSTPSITLTHSLTHSLHSLTHEQEVLATFGEWCKVSASRSSLLVVLDAIDHLSAPAKKAPWARPEELSWLPAPSPHIRVVLSVRLEAAGSVAGGAVGGQEAGDAVCVCVCV